ncbi:MAG TPA: sigma-70 family RNA polymerase sigma factor [Gemmatimonadales bacterium]|nr:sigma-70 family RNA polymerase sigma factor [Gemmatimonadales bacterium]
MGRSQVGEHITDLLHEIRAGHPEAMDRLFHAVYGELRRIASRQLQGERPGHTLGTTGLVHEAYLRLVDQTRVEWRNRSHFYAIAAQAMRRILVDYARQHQRTKRGGGRQPLTLDENVVSLNERSENLIALDEALTRLAAFNPRLSQVVECRFFAGLTEEEIAEATGVAVRTVKRDWAKARGWLYKELSA